MTDFPEYLLEHAIGALRGIPEAERADVYVVSFFVYDEDDDPARPTLTVGTNTERAVQSALESTDEPEARWNYAFWQKDHLAVIADRGLDPVGVELRDDWIRAHGLSPDDYDEISQLFVRLCIDTVKELHSGGTIRTVFGRSIPVIIHELEYYDAIVDQNVEANPDGLVSGLAAWVGSM